MEQFEETSLWARTLAKSNDSERTEAARERLRTAFLGFRRRAAQLADEIPQNLRTLTVHDVTHLDALWEVADIIAGEDYDINPAEAFVLGGAILLHDLGMSLSSYNAGLSDLKQHSSWPDVVYNLLQKDLKRPPRDDELADPGPMIEDQAANQILREAHAKHAADLAKIGFGQPGDAPYYLLEDVELRTQIGGLIGEIAYSHWWPIEKVAKRFATKIGSFIFAPKSWTIDPLKIACLLRCSDACHLDGRRAPSFLMALRKPTGVAKLHWTFQERLQKPTVENNRFVFTTSRPFQPTEHQAWWLCFETLQVADRELRQSNMALADLGRKPFLLHGVSGVDAAERMLKYIPTQGWEPIDINVRVSDVPGLVKKLGGTSLYGQSPIVPLRELIQNGCDAVRARRVFEARPSSWGEVTICSSREGESEIIVVSDSGVGMSREVLIGPLLDFGESYWNSRLAQDELPGLARKGFNATGGFGIGFYSAFMWGDDVKVITRSRNASPSETLVLHFQQGLQVRPILRVAEAAEQLTEPGTSVAVRLAHTSVDKIIEATSDYSDSYYEPDERPYTFSELCAWLCPASDVDIVAQFSASCPERVVEGADWKTLAPSKLLRRTYPKAEIADTTAAEVGKRMRPIVRDGETLARLAIVADLPDDLYSTVTAGILRSSTDCSDIAGISLGTPSTASRMSATSVVTTEELRTWATEQRQLLDHAGLAPRASITVAKVLRRCGAETGDLVIAQGRDRLLTFRDILETEWPDEIILVHSSTYENTKSLVPDAKLLPNSLSIDYSGIGDEGLPLSWHLHKSGALRWRYWNESLMGAAIEAFSIAWAKPLDELINQADSRKKCPTVWGEGKGRRKFSDRHVYVLTKKRS